LAITRPADGRSDRPRRRQWPRRPSGLHRWDRPRAAT
jgi:hypothetical protein